MAIFKELEMISIADDGKLWGEIYYYPLLIVDRESRHFVTNHPLSFSENTENDNVFIGFLPDKYIIASTATIIDTVLFTLVAIDELDFDTNKILEISIHEMFHYWQYKNNLHQNSYNNSHLDTKWGRIYLILEIKALQKTLLSNTFAEKKESLTEALFFRQQRHLFFPDKINDETNFELAEGLANYTETKLPTKHDSLITQRVNNDAENLLSKKTFVRNFGYVTGSIYATLNDHNPFWREDIRNITDLADLTKLIYEIEYIPTKLSDSILALYNYEHLLQIEDSLYNRKKLFDEVIKEKLENSKQIKLNFSGCEIGFNPNELYAIEEAGTYFPYCLVSGSFGTIHTTNGAVLQNDNIIIFFCDKKIKFKRKSIKSDGITLTFNKGYFLKKQKRTYEIVNK